MKINRWAIAALSMAAVASMASAGVASAAPVPPISVTANHNGITEKAPRAGLLPFGRTSAGAVPVKMPIPDAATSGELAKMRPEPLQRPVGAEKYEGEPLGHPELRLLCTSAINAESTSGAAYLVSAGHCMKDVSSTTGKFYYPDQTFTVMGNTGSRWNYDGTGDYGAIRMNWDQDPANWLGSDGVIRTYSAVGNPVLNETVQGIFGNSHKTVTATIINANTCATFSDGPVSHCNLAVLQWNIANGGCAIGGDSGSPIIAGHDFVGILNAGSASGGHCFVWATRGAFALQQYNLFAG